MIDQTNVSKPDRFDVVVIGGGIAGSVAASRAAQLGLSVALLERGAEANYPCNSRYSGGILHVAFRNVKEPEGELVEAIAGATRGEADPALAKALAETSGRAVDWLRDEGAKFIRVGQIVWQQWMLAPPRRLAPGLDWEGRGPDVTLRILAENLIRRGGRICLNTTATALLEKDRRCTGVEAISGGSKVAFGSGAVILADGGFQANLDLVRAHISTQPEKIKQRGAATGRGDGLRMAQALGAAVTDLRGFYGHLLSRDAFANPRVWPYPQLDELGTSGIVVNDRAERIADEGRGGVYMANSVARLSDPLSCVALFDENIWQGPGRAARIPANPNLIKAGGTLFKADNLAALARQIGVGSDKLEETVRNYNAAYHAGALSKLEPPRSGSTVPAVPIEQPPFYAVPLCAGITHTMGGVVVDGDGCVLRPDGSAIPGLYAAGTVTGGLEGGETIGYVGGLMQAVVFGLRAAEHIAKAVS